MAELKPGPFCGGVANLDSYPGEAWEGDGTWHCVRCKTCYIRTCDYKSARKAVEAWNRRAGDGK